MFKVSRVSEHVDAIRRRSVRSQEAKSFQTNEEVKAMTDLVQAYQANDIASFESLLEKHKKSISEDCVCRRAHSSVVG